MENFLGVVKNLSIENKVYTEIMVSEFHNNSSEPGITKSQYFRTDFTKGLIYKAYLDNDTITYEELYMDLLAEVGDTIPLENGIILINESSSDLFNLNTTKREFRGVISPYRILEFVKGFGLNFNLTEDLLSFATDSLKGCVINGVVYGDTSLITGVNDKPQGVFNYKLGQNYPNPFNPTTTIGYRIPETGLVTLKVYDILGREVATLVNEEKPAGTYEIEFNSHSGEVRNLPSGRQGLTSGVYFYQLKSDSFVETRKMILIK